MKHWVLLLIDNYLKTATKIHAMIFFLYYHFGGKSLQSKFEHLLKCQAEAKWLSTTLPLPLGSQFNRCCLAGYFLVGIK